MTYKNFLTILLLVLLLSVSLLPRSIEVLNGNPVFEIDQGRDFLAVKHIVVDHKFTLIGAELGAGQAGLSYLFHGPGYFYLLSVPFLLFNGNPVGGVWLMLLLGLGTIGFGMYFASRFLGKREGLLMGFLLALCPYLIGQSRFFENHFGAPLFILIVFYFTYRLTQEGKENKTKFIFFAAAVAAGIYNLEFAIAIPLCITLTLYSIVLFRTRFKQYIPLILGFLLGFSPMILFELRHGFMGPLNLIHYVFAHQEIKSTAPSLLMHARDIYNLFVLSFSDSFPGTLFPNRDVAVLLFFTLVFFVFCKETKKANKQILLFLLLLFPVNFLVFMPLRTIVFEHYITDLILAYPVLLVYSLSFLFRNKHTKAAVVISVFLIILCTQGAYKGFVASLSDYHDYGGVHKLRGKMDAIDFIYKDANKKPFGLLVFSPGVYTYPYDYLIWWYGAKKYGYTPSAEKKGTFFYLLIEKDFRKPWSYQGWEETVVKTGTVVFTKTLPSEFIVEKRRN